ISKQVEEEGLSPEGRKKLAKTVENYLLNTKEEAAQARDANVNLPSSVVQDEFEEPLSEVLKQWEELILTLDRPSVFYQPVTEEEKRSVIASFTAEYSHWYTCVNGHIFTIANCGGANQVSRCNECGEPIGGTNYQTVSGVRQAVDLERIAGEHGAMPSPWGWNGNKSNPSALNSSKFPSRALSAKSARSYKKCIRSMFCKENERDERTIATSVLLRVAQSCVLLFNSPLPTGPSCPCNASPVRKCSAASFIAPKFKHATPTLYIARVYFG
ncbi:13707_t:CDS:2, partial [Acaulospora colombiana]